MVNIILIKLVDKYNNTYHRSNGKKPIDADYSDLSKETESSHKGPKFKVGDRVRIIKYKNIFIKCYTENWSKEIFCTVSVLKTNAWTYKIKDLYGEALIGRFCEKELLLSKL